MEKEVYLDDKRIVDITHMVLPTGYGNRKANLKVYVFEDGTYIRVNITKGKQFKYICSECGNEFFTGTRPEYGRNVYICRRCLSLNHNGMSGKHHTEEYKQKKSKQMQGRYVGENNPMYGVNWKDLVSPEVIKEHSRKLSERFSGENNPMYGKSWKDYTTQEVIDGHRQKQIDIYKNLSEEEKEIRRQRMAENERRRREADPEKYREEKSRAGKIGMSKREAYTKTKPEIIVENWLNENNIPNEYSPIMGDGNRNYQYDFIIKGKKILIEVN